MELRVRALESVLTQKGYIDPAALDRLIDTYQTRIGPQWRTRCRPSLGRLRIPRMAAA